MIICDLCNKKNSDIFVKTYIISIGEINSKDDFIKIELCNDCRPKMIQYIKEMLKHIDISSIDEEIRTQKIIQIAKQGIKEL